MLTVQLLYDRVITTTIHVQLITLKSGESRRSSERSDGNVKLNVRKEKNELKCLTEVPSNVTTEEF